MQKHKPVINGKDGESAGHFRKNMAEGERMHWPWRPGKQMRGGQFYSHKSSGHCIMDFSAQKANLVVKEDGSQPKRTKLENKGKRVEAKRLNAIEVVREIDIVNQRIHEVVKKGKR